MITVSTKIKSTIEKVWDLWTEPTHIQNWNNASDDWHTPHAENDLRLNGRFKFTMAAKDGSFQFDFSGVYTHVEYLKQINYTIDDGRKVSISFSDLGNEIELNELFDPESVNSLELQQGGWQAILNNFKKYVESN